MHIRTRKLLILGSVICSLSSPSVAADLSRCDKIVAGGSLIYSKGYTFFDIWKNGGNQPDYMNNFWISYSDETTDWTERETPARAWNYLDPGKSFNWTQKLRDAEFTVREQSEMRIIETGSNWKIAKRGTGAGGTSDDYDFALMFIKSYDNTNTPKDYSDDIEQVSCVFYGIE